MILTDLLATYTSGDLCSLEDQVKNLPRTNFSLQDRKKCDYLCFRKARECGDSERVDTYLKKRKFDDAFEEALGNLS